ncbi:MAG: hypothetical protein AAGF04_01495 [Chlamydiota bacterium]
MTRIISYCFCLFLSFALPYWAWETVPEFRSFVNQLLSLGKFQTLEVRYSPESIMERNRRQLLLDAEHAYLEPQLTFYPYLLMEVKYTAQNSQKTAEGILLWSLIDGEMVINTSNWQETHGFSDCIYARAGKQEFKIINTLVDHGGRLDREGLVKALKNVENEKLNLMLENCRRKNLIVQKGNIYRLHMQDPKLGVRPITNIDQRLVTKPAKKAERMTARFRTTHIKETAKAAFGEDFAIRKEMLVYLPVYLITVQNPDGSQMTTFWNALNGKQIDQPYYLG